MQIFNKCQLFDKRVFLGEHVENIEVHFSNDNFDFSRTDDNGTRYKQLVRTH